MDLKYLTIVVLAVVRVIAMDDTSADETEGRNANTLLEKVFGYGEAGDIIAGYVDNNDLANMAKFPAMSESANIKRNRLCRILHYRDGKVMPPYLTKAFERITQVNATRHWGYRWKPHHVILFGSEKPFSVMRDLERCDITAITPLNNRLEIFYAYPGSQPFVPVEIKGSPVNGFIIPYTLTTTCPLRVVLSYATIPAILGDDKCFLHGYKSLENKKSPLKLAIVISSDGNSTSNDAESRALRAAERIREEHSGAQICVVAQSDKRSIDEKEKDDMYDLRPNSRVIMFHGLDVSASTFLVDTKNDETLERKLHDWKTELSFVNMCQTIAFHFTLPNGTEPENSEEIFRKTFPDTPLSTLRLLDESSTVGVNYPFGTQSLFHAGPVYAIVGFRKLDG